MDRQRLREMETLRSAVHIEVRSPVAEVVTLPVVIGED